jgi:hypothetical protein
VIKVKVQITKMEVNVVYVQAVIPVVAVHVAGLESNIAKMGGQINRME